MRQVSHLHSLEALATPPAPCSRRLLTGMAAGPRPDAVRWICNILQGPPSAPHHHQLHPQQQQQPPQQRWGPPPSAAALRPRPSSAARRQVKDELLKDMAGGGQAAAAPATAASPVKPSKQQQQWQQQQQQQWQQQRQHQWQQLLQGIQLKKKQRKELSRRLSEADQQRWGHQPAGGQVGGGHQVVPGMDVPLKVSKSVEAQHKWRDQLSKVGGVTLGPWEGGWGWGWSCGAGRA